MKRRRTGSRTLEKSTNLKALSVLYLFIKFPLGRKVEKGDAARKGRSEDDGVVEVERVE